MNYTVNEEIRNQAKKCAHNFQCLNNEDFRVCPAIDFVAEKVLFVDAKHYVVCPYLLPFADSNICHCPVRIKLYEKYKV